MTGRPVAPLTEQQHKILTFLSRAVALQGYSPSLREIGEAVGLASGSTVLGHMRRLEEKGYIRREPTKPRAVQILSPEGELPPAHVAAIPVMEPSGSGGISLAPGDPEPWLPFPSSFLPGDSSAYCFLNATGDSMVEAGICAGDWLLVRRQDRARNGQIVVAVVDGEPTVKYYYKERDRIRLQPANRFMDPIWVKEVHVIGEVVSLLRPSVYPLSV